VVHRRQADLKLGSNADLVGRVFFSKLEQPRRRRRAHRARDRQLRRDQLTDPNIYAGASLFVNPNFGYTAILPGAQAGRNPADPQAVAVVLGHAGHLQQSLDAQPTSAFVNPISRVNSCGTTQLHYIYTYHFPNMDLKYIGGYQQYNYTLALATRRRHHLHPAGHRPTNRLVINPTATCYLEDDAFAQEVSLQSTDSSPFQWIVAGSSSSALTNNINTETCSPT